MLKELDKYFQNFIEERAEELRLTMKSNIQYQDLIEQIITAKQNILGVLTEDKKDTFFELEGLQGSLDCLINERIFEQGVLDGLSISHIIKKF